MSRKPLTVDLSAATASEIADVVARTQRSPAFVALRALTAAPRPDTEAKPLPEDGPRTTVALTTGEDDPANTLAKLAAAAGTQPLSQALHAAWEATREKFQRWAAREEALRGTERADELDEALRAAGDSKTTADELAALAKSVYPRVRALAAVHPTTPTEAIARLREDREPYVREAAARRT